MQGVNVNMQQVFVIGNIDMKKMQHNFVNMRDNHVNMIFELYCILTKCSCVLHIGATECQDSYHT